jgi:hypothetical protein
VHLLGRSPSSLGDFYNAREVNKGLWQLRLGPARQ